MTVKFREVPLHNMDMELRIKSFALYGILGPPTVFITSCRLKNKISIFIFTLYFRLFLVLFVKIRCELSEIRGTESLSPRSAMTFNSRRLDVTSIEHNIDQS